uniref:Protein jagunal n=1 Tax=Syphacia muris TaxID=451379 RepID=A0A0N5AC46_9BILA
MSSRGPRANGTDGTDFTHRQKIASHYQISVQYKWYLKWLFAIHVLVLLAFWVKVFGEFLTRYTKIRWAFFISLDLPSAYPWEYVWSLSFVPIIFALLSFNKNRVKILRYHYYGQFVFGIMPCAIGIGSQFPELIDYIFNRENSKTPTFNGNFPMVILWYIFFLVAFQIHGLAMYFSHQLILAWMPPKKKD